MAVAFSTLNPNLGYAVGKQGALLAYDKTWTQQTLPASVAQANMTSVAFAGNDAIVGYRMLDPNNPSVEEGGILVNNGSGWQIDRSAQALLATLPAGQTVISKVAGLPDGGAVAAGPGVVLERDSAASPWRFSTTPLADSSTGNIAALAAIREGSSVRALVSVDDDPMSDPSGTDNLLWQEIDNPPAPAPGQPSLLLGPDPLPSQGFLVRETANGWVDEELDDYPNLLGGGVSNEDLPGWPDPVLALVVNSSGQQGWAAGGQTGGDELQLSGAAGAANAVETAGVMRFGGGVSPPVSTTTPISIPSGEATFALGGGSGCAAACADDAAQHLGPDVWLSGAITRASQIKGLRAFLYAGQRVGAGAAALGPDGFDRELSDYDGVLSSAGGSFPVYAAATAADVDPAAGGAANFAQMLGDHAPGGSSPAGTPAPPTGSGAYSFDSSGNGGTVRVIVLDYSEDSLEGAGAAQLDWLAAQLDSASKARIPAIVVGGDDITNASSSNSASDGATVEQVLLTHGASAYLFYDADGENVSKRIGNGRNSIPAYGSGTLGYVAPPSNAAAAAAFLGAGGFLLVSVDGAQRDPNTNRAPVSASLIPDAGQLALDPTDGTLLRRSEVALFQGLARRPEGGEEWSGDANAKAPDPYVVLPETCLGAACSEFIKPTYSFSSSDPSIGNFVEHDPNATNPRQILQDSHGNPIPDPTSGLFCAYNPGTTIVTITTGGLSYSIPVTVQQGSIEEPCGTVPGKVVTITQPGSSPGASTPALAPSPTVAPTVPVALSVPPPPPPPPGVLPPPALPPLTLPLLAAAPPVVAALPVPPRVILPIATFTARPIPPIGFGTVAAIAPLSVRVVEEQREDEEAVETARSAFAVYNPNDSGPLVPGIGMMVLVVVLAGAGTGAALRLRRRHRGGAAFARADTRPRRRW